MLALGVHLLHLSWTAESGKGQITTSTENSLQVDKLWPWEGKVRSIMLCNLSEPANAYHLEDCKDRFVAQAVLAIPAGISHAKENQPFHPLCWAPWYEKEVWAGLILSIKFSIRLFCKALQATTKHKS